MFAHWLRPLFITASTALWLAACTTSPPAPPPAPVAPIAGAPGTLDPGSVTGFVVQRSQAQALDPVSVVLSPDLEFVAAIRTSGATRPLDANDLQALGLDRSAALLLAKANVAAGLRPFEDLVVRPIPQPFGRIEGDYGEASRLALHDAWAPLAHAANGHLVVAAPAADIVFYADGSGPDAVQRLRAAAHLAYAEASRKVSDEVLRWTPSGWEPAS